MHNVEIDIALRQLLKHFRLPGEAQKIDHIIQVFYKKNFYCLTLLILNISLGFHLFHNPGMHIVYGLVSFPIHTKIIEDMCVVDMFQRCHGVKKISG